MHDTPQATRPADQPAPRRGAPSLRDAVVTDAAAIADIYNESIAVGDATMDETPKSTRDVERQLAGFNDRETILVFERDEGDDGRPDQVQRDEVQRILGWGIIKRYSDRPGYRFCCETSVYLRRSAVGRGLGTRMKLALIERCRTWGYHHLVAKIFADNRGSIAYNLKLGYEMVGIQRQIGFRNGRWQDVAILQLILDDTANDTTHRNQADSARDTGAKT